MKTTFTKQNFNPDFDHQAEIIATFNKMGYTKLSITTDMTNGLSHYVKVYVDVVDYNKCFAEMFVWENKTEITVRISDHFSNLERICGGVCGNKMTMSAFKKLIENKAIQSYN